MMGHVDPNQMRALKSPRHAVGMTIFSKSAGSSKRLIHLVYSPSSAGGPTSKTDGTAEIHW
eukprot:6928248-Prymnesium_polylepis.1